MTVIRWNPLREIDDLFARAGHFPPLGQNHRNHQNSRNNLQSSFTPLADVSETPSSYLIELELPGVAADQVEVSVHEGVVTAQKQTAQKQTAQKKPVLSDRCFAGNVAMEPLSAGFDCRKMPRLKPSRRVLGKAC